MRYILLALAVIVILIMTAGAIAVHFFGWWAIPVIVLVTFGGAWLFIRYGLRAFIWRLLMRPFLQQGEVLRGARVEVHSVTRIPDPNPHWPTQRLQRLPLPPNSRRIPDDFDDFGDTDDEIEDSEEPTEPAAWVEIEVTITPKDAASVVGETRVFRYWDLTHLQMASTTEAADEEFVRLVTCEIWNGKRYDNPDNDQQTGEQRLRLRVHIADSVRAVLLRYFFENLATIELPALTGT